MITIPTLNISINSKPLSFKRLEIQHRLSIKIFENRLYLVPVSLGKRDCVLDSGTGGGTLDGNFIEDTQMAHFSLHSILGT